jgi:cbb3-type cytochrome oxidase cytochrome c subunit
MTSFSLCSECGRQTNDWHWRNCRIQCRRCWELSNMPSYLRVQTRFAKSIRHTAKELLEEE